MREREEGVQTGYNAAAELALHGLEEAGDRFREATLLVATALCGSAGGRGRRRLLGSGRVADGAFAGLGGAESGAVVVQMGRARAQVLEGVLGRVELLLALRLDDALAARREGEGMLDLGATGGGLGGGEHMHKE